MPDVFKKDPELFSSRSCALNTQQHASLFSHCPSHPWEPRVLPGAPQWCLESGPQLTLDREAEGPHGLPGCVADSTAV